MNIENGQLEVSKEQLGKWGITFVDSELGDQVITEFTLIPKATLTPETTLTPEIILIP